MSLMSRVSCCLTCLVLKPLLWEQIKVSSVIDKNIYWEVIMFLRSLIAWQFVKINSMSNFEAGRTFENTHAVALYIMACDHYLEKNLIVFDCDLSMLFGCCKICWESHIISLDHQYEFIIVIDMNSYFILRSCSTNVSFLSIHLRRISSPLQMVITSYMQNLMEYLLPMNFCTIYRDSPSPRKLTVTSGFMSRSSRLICTWTPNLEYLCASLKPPVLMDVA